MTISEMKEKIDDTSISDEALFQIMLAFVEEATLNTASLEELEDLGVYTDQKRPRVADRLRKLVVDEHKGRCCGNSKCSEDDPK